MIMCLPRVGSQRSPRISADVMRSVALWRRVSVIWCGTEVRFHRVQYPQTFFFPPAWILMRPHADKSNMSSAVLMYTRVSESPCPGRPVWTPQNLIYDWQLIWKSQNTPAWPSERDSVDEKTALARFVSQPTVWPRRPAFICLHTLPPPPSPKNSLISNGLILCFHYGLCMFSLMAFFQSYSIEQKKDYKMSFSLKKKKRIRLEIENVRDPSCSHLMVCAADNRVWDRAGRMMTEKENEWKASSHSSNGNCELEKDAERHGASKVCRGRKESDKCPESWVEIQTCIIFEPCRFCFWLNELNSKAQHDAIKCQKG